MADERQGPREIPLSTKPSLWSKLARLNRIPEAQRRAEASRQLEEVLVDEQTALGEHLDLPPVRPALGDSDIVDLHRLAEYLYESAVKEMYDDYSIGSSTAGAKYVVRARIWDTFDEDLRNRLEALARSSRHVDRPDDVVTRGLLVEALNRLILADLPAPRTERPHP